MYFCFTFFFFSGCFHRDVDGDSRRIRVLCGTGDTYSDCVVLLLWNRVQKEKSKHESYTVIIVLNIYFV